MINIQVCVGYFLLWFNDRISIYADKKLLTPRVLLEFSFCSMVELTQHSSFDF